MPKEDKREKKEMDEKIGRQAAKAAMKWYGWGSPIGLSIFLISIILIIALIKFIFFG